MPTPLNRSRPLREIIEINKIRDIDVTPLVRVQSQTQERDSYLLIKDSAPGSQFFFSVDNVDFTPDPVYLLMFAPFNEDSSGAQGIWVSPSQFRPYYDKWLDLINSYSENLNASLQDSILEGYEQEFAEWFELTDEDADTHSFDKARQDGIDNILNEVYDRLKKYKEQSVLTDDVVKEIDNLLRDIERLRETQNRQSKRQVKNQLLNVMARFRKALPNHMLTIAGEVIKAVLVNGAIEAGTKLLGP